MNSLGDNRFMKIAYALPLILFAGLVGQATAQTLDSSGDGMLSGTYYFRQVAYYYNASTEASDLTSIYGTITFNGSGSYSLSGSVCDYENSCGNGAQPVTNFTLSGSYVIGANGFGYITSPYGPVLADLGLGTSGDLIYGLVSHGVFTGSATETTQPYNDLFIAAQLGSPAATNSTFSGTYSVAYTDPSLPTDAFFQLSPNGSGTIGTVSASGYYESGYNSDGSAAYSPQSQTSTGVQYSFSNGAASVSFGGNSNNALLPPSVLLYISPDGNFVFGGAYNGWDIFVGVRTGSATPNFNGLYYQAGIDSDLVYFDTYYGSLNAYSDGTILDHQRLPLLVSTLPGDYTFYDSYSLSGNAYDDEELSQHYVFSSNGAYRIGYGQSYGGYAPILGINVAVQAPTFSGSGMYLNPTGVLNDASFAPFTARLSPGELVALFGTGLSTQTASASTLPLPTTLGGVKVVINGFSAPLIFVSPTQINAVIPYEVTNVAQIQVVSATNSSQTSNTVTELMNYDTSPGIFTYNPADGTGYAAALHQNFSVVSPSNPAQPGEVIQVYVTGLGAVTPAVNDGSPGTAISPYNTTTNTIQADVNGTIASVGFSGLAPGFAGVYQLNISIPTGLTPGDNPLDISGPDSYTSEALISIGSGSAAVGGADETAQARSAAGPQVHAKRPANKHARSIPRPVARKRDAQ